MRTLLLGLIIVGIIVSTSLRYEHKQERPIAVSYQNLLPTVKTQIDCLSDNIYHEAAHEGELGWLGVAQVTMNRTKSKQFPSSVCSVVKQRTQRVCQFSWLCEKSKPVNKAIYKQVRQFAVYTYMNYDSMKDVTNGALYYHADYVNPDWSNLKKTTKIGRHIFYKPKRNDQYDEQTKPSVERWWEQSSRQLIYAFDGRHFSRVLQTSN